MTVQAQIDRYVADQPPSKREEMQALHRMILGVAPNCRLWFLDGRNGDGKIVSNPNIGYGQQTISYANGDSRDFYQIGVSANTAGLSVYVMGIEDRRYLADTYGKRLGKASVTGYCVKFRRLSDVNLEVFEEMIASHMGRGR
jgi:hypothetical protein